MSRRPIFRAALLDVLTAWGAVALGVALAAMLLALTSCGSSSRGSVAEPPIPPVTPPPVQPPPPPPHVVVRDVTVSVTLAGQPVSSARVILAPGVDAATDSHGVARFAYLDAGAYEVAVRDAPPLAVQVLEPVIYVAPDARVFAVELLADIGDGQLVLGGDSDSSEPVDWRTSSVDDHLAGAAALAGWPEYRHSNCAQPCTSVAPTGCEHRAIEQVESLPLDAAIVVMRWGLNDLHYQVGPDSFASHYADALDEVIARGAVPVVVGIQAEETPSYRGRRDAYNRDLAALAAERGAVYVDPGIVWAVDRELFADDGTHLNDAGTRRVGDAVLDGLRRALTVGTLVINAPASAACPRFGSGWMLGASYYGLASYDRADIASDLPWLRSLGVCLLRVWLDWSVPDDGARVFRADGSVREDRWADLEYSAEIADGLGIQLDLTLGDGLDDDAARERALDTIARRFAGRPVVAVVDAWNEIDSQLSVSAVERYVRAVKRADPGRLVTVSISGEWDTIIDGYERIDHVVDLAAPHSPRKNEWWKRLEPGMVRLIEATGLDGYAQEEARELYHGTDHWPVEAYVEACESMCALGVPYVQHSEAGFNGAKGSWRAQVDSTTLAALTAMSADGCGCAP